MANPESVCRCERKLARKRPPGTCVRLTKKLLNLRCVKASSQLKKGKTLFYLGIDIGASSVKVAAVDAAGQLLCVQRRAHQGSPVPCLRGMLDDLAAGTGAGAGAVALGAPEGAGMNAGDGEASPASVASGSVSASSMSFDLAECAGFVATGSGADMLCALLPGVRVLEDIPATVRGVQEIGRAHV